MTCIHYRKLRIHVQWWPQQVPLSSTCYCIFNSFLTFNNILTWLCSDTGLSRWSNQSYKIKNYLKKILLSFSLKSTMVRRLSTFIQFSVTCHLDVFTYMYYNLITIQRKILKQSIITNIDYLCSKKLISARIHYSR